MKELTKEGKRKDMEGGMPYGKLGMGKPFGATIDEHLALCIKTPRGASEFKIRFHDDGSVELIHGVELHELKDSHMALPLRTA